MTVKCKDCKHFIDNELGPYDSCAKKNNIYRSGISCIDFESKGIKYFKCKVCGHETHLNYVDFIEYDNGFEFNKCDQCGVMIHPNSLYNWVIYKEE
jgi:hypothetical protein